MGRKGLNHRFAVMFLLGTAGQGKQGDEFVTAKDNANRQQKADTIATVKQSLLADETQIVLVTKNKGLTVAAVSDLRRKAQEAGASYKVAKNTLVKLALEGSRYASLSSLFVGPTAVTTANDPVAAAKVIADFAKDNDKLEIVGAAFGEQVLDAKGVQALAKLPSLNELRATIIGLIQAPATKVAGVIQAPASQLARLMSAKAAKEEA